MNFLSHYYIIKHDKRPFYSFGNILPDLIRIFDKNTRISENLKVNPKDKILVDIIEGVNFHHYADSLFHNSSFFKKNTGKITQLLKESDLKSIDKYLFFIAHILFEIMLDRILIQKNEHLCNTFYDSLSKVREKDVKLLFDAINLKTTSEGFYNFFDQFRKAEYLKEYVHNEKLIYALNRVYNRISPINFEEEDKMKLEQVILQIEKDLSKEYPRGFTF